MIWLPCSNTAPNPTADAFVCNINVGVVIEKSRYIRIGAFVSTDFN